MRFKAVVFQKSQMRGDDVFLESEVCDLYVELGRMLEILLGPLIRITRHYRYSVLTDRPLVSNSNE